MSLPGQKLEYIATQRCVSLRRNPQFLTPAQMTALKDSILRDGFVSPILVRPLGDQYEILSGNHRLMAAVEIGLPMLSAVIIQPTAEQAGRLAVNLNTVHGDPPVETLAPFLAEMDDATLRTIHVDEATARQLTLFDSHLAQRLAELETPENLDHKSNPNTIPNCICPTCCTLPAWRRQRGRIARAPTWCRVLLV